MKKTRTMKKVASIATAALMTACLAVPMATGLTASAATAGKITFVSSTETLGTHTYTAYRIFTGDAADDGFGGKAELKNIQWDMTTTNADAFLTNLKAADVIGSDFADCDTAVDVAEVLKTYDNNSEKSKAFAKVVVANKALLRTTATSTANGGVNSIALTEDGYYVIEESAFTPANGTDLTGGGTRSAYILGVYDASKGADVEVKSKMPSFQKKVKDANDSTDTAETVNNWQDSADHDINDQVPFQLKATLPENYSEYNEYKLVFHDNLGSKMVDDDDDPETDEVEVPVFTLKNDSFVVYVDKNDNGTVDEGEAIAYNLSTSGTEANCDFEIIIDNLKTVNGIANGMDVIVEYTAALNDDAVIGELGNWNDAYLEYSNNPNFENAGTNGKDDDNDGEIDEEDEDTEDTTSTTKKDQVVVFTYQLSVDKVDAANNALPGAGFTLYKYNGTEFVAVGSEITGVTTFSFTGIDDGIYKLSETTIPDGYNGAADVYFKVVATHDETADTPTLKSLNVYECEYDTETGAITVAQENEADKTFGTVTLTNGLIKTDVINNSGQELPSTGGIGTTLFYLIGGTMFAGSGVYLISKKRMKNKEEQ